MKSNIKITIIAAYFGKLPNYFHLFLESCSYNHEFNWLIFTDDKTVYNYPVNVKPIYVSFESIQKRIKHHIGDFALCHKPYKLCDYRPTYGLIFRDYLNDADYWGHCDIDLIWGNLFKFLQIPLEKKYDRILGYGHLSLYKNNERVNNYFKLPFKGINYKYVFTHKASFGFDEKRGVNKLFQENGIDYWHEEIMIDIKRPYEDLSFNAYNINNHFKQAFIFNSNRKLVQLYYSNDKINKLEYAYIHFQKRDMKKVSETLNEIQITPEGILPISTLKDEALFRRNQSPNNKYSRINYLYRDLIAALKYKCHIIFNKLCLQ